MGLTVTFESTSPDLETGADTTRIEGYFALPASGQGIGILLIQEWWGLVPHITTLADRLAAAGFVVLAPDLYRGAQTTEPDEAAKLMMGLDIARVATDLAGAAAYLASREEVTGTRIGVVGFCMGGGLALLSGSVSPYVAATAAFYPATPWSGFDPDWSRYAGSTLSIHRAEHDGPNVVPLTEQWAREVRTVGGTVEVYDYQGTSHAFVNDDRPEVYDAAATTLAWERVIAQFLAITD